MQKYVALIQYNAIFDIIMKFFTKIESANEKEYIETALKDIENFLGVNITVHDRRGLLRDSKGNPLLPGRNLHPHPYCIEGRYTEPGWNSACVRDCFWNSEAVAERELKPFLKRCWKGTAELVFPVVQKNTHILTLYAGTFRKADDLEQEQLLPKKILKMYKQLPVWDDAKMESCARILYFAAQGIIECVNQQNETENAPLGRADEIQAYLRYNAHKNIKLIDLAKHLCLSPSRTSHLVTKCLGRPFQEQLIRERMLRARTLLLSSNQVLEDISAAVGISNVYYFGRLFKKFYGKPPGIYRKHYILEYGIKQTY